MVDLEEDFQEILKQLHLPDEVRDALMQNGYDCTLTFGLAFSSMQMLDQHINKFLPPGETDLTSPTCARIRALYGPNTTIYIQPQLIPPAQPFPPIDRIISSTHCHFQLA